MSGRGRIVFGVAVLALAGGVAGGAWWWRARGQAATTAEAGSLRAGFEAMNRRGRDPTAVATAIAEFETALRARPDDAEALFGLGWALHAQGDRVRAETLYRQAALRASRARLATVEYFSRYDLGVLYRELGQQELAAAEFQEAATVGESNLATVGEQVGNAWYDYGRTLAQLGRHREAAVALNQAAARLPRSGVIRLERGRALWRYGQRDLAGADLDEAVRLSPDLAPEVAKVREIK